MQPGAGNLIHLITALPLSLMRNCQYWFPALLRLLLPVSQLRILSDVGPGWGSNTPRQYQFMRFLENIYMFQSFRYCWCIKNVILLISILSIKLVILAVILTKEDEDRYSKVQNTLNTVRQQTYKRVHKISTTKSIFILKSEKKVLLLRFMWKKIYNFKPF